jgi:hypothetical protein
MLVSSILISSGDQAKLSSAESLLLSFKWDSTLEECKTSRETLKKLILDKNV